MEENIDPVFRCDSCSELVKLDTLHKLGACSKCGNRRVRSLTVMSADEKRLIESWGFDDFLASFEAIPGGDA